MPVVNLLLGAAAAALIIGLLAGIGHFLLSRPAPRDPLADVVLSATAPRAAEAAPLQPVTNPREWTDEDLRSCKEKATNAAEEARKRKLAAVSADRVGLGGPDPEMVERATYLLCGASQKPLHLCDDYWHGWFVDAMKAYAVEFRSVSSSDYWNKMNLADKARRDDPALAAKYQTIATDLDQTTREVSLMNDGIVGAFRKLIADGIITPADFSAFFGFGIPPEIGAMIGDAKPERNLCEG